MLLKDADFSDEAILKAFPWEQPREGQIEAVRFVLEAFKDGKDYVVLEGPTGSGKSVIGITVSNFFKNSFYLTIQKSLQAQLIGDFEHVVSLMGRNAYPCTYYARNESKLKAGKRFPAEKLKELLDKPPGCDNGFCKDVLDSNKCGGCFLQEHKGDLMILPPGMKYSACPYYEQLGLALAAPHVTMNYSCFLSQTYYAGRFPPRELMICDEAHNVQSVIMDFISLTINDFQLQEYGITLPELEEPKDYAHWIKDNDVVKIIGYIIAAAESTGDKKTVEKLSEVLFKIGLFLLSAEDPEDEWVSDYTTSKNAPYNHTVCLRPVFVRHFSQDLLFGYAKKNLLMSATILHLDSFCNATGLDRSKVAAYRMKNRIPASNRKVLVLPVLKATGGDSKMGEWMPTMIKEVDKLCEIHKDHKGIIHTHNFAICNGLLEKCKHRKRFLFQKNFADKQHLLRHHAATDKSIIIAPAMHEGFDLKNDLSRFQIICKVPYPNFYADKQLKRRSEIDWNYILWLTALKLIQSSGRSIRSETDWAMTYIIDSTFLRFREEANFMIPKWFQEAIEVIEN